MKKIIFITVLIFTLVISFTVVFAEEKITVRIDSNEVEFNENIGSPFIDMNSRTQVPFRATLEKYGAEVKWDNVTRTAIAKKGNITIEVPIGQYYIIRNGEKITTDTVAVIKDNRTYLPIRSVIEAFGSEVQWDNGFKTVVITTTPIDAKKILIDSYVKSNKWESYDCSMLMDLSMNYVGEKGKTEKIETKTNISMSVITEPKKIKSEATIIMEYAGMKFSQPLMKIYYLLEDNSFVTYIGTYDESGELTWAKSIAKYEKLSEMKDDNDEFSLETFEKSIKDVKYFGKYFNQDGRTLSRFENTTSGKVYSDLFGSFIEALSSSTNEAEILTADLFRNMGDFKFIIYIDEETGEIAGYEMDLSSIYSSLFNEIDNISKEELEVLKTMKVKVFMDMMNINEVEDFAIPQEALNAPEM